MLVKTLQNVQFVDILVQKVIEFYHIVNVFNTNYILI